MATETDPDGPAKALRDPAELGPRFAEFARGLDRPVVFLDIESTGTDPQSDRIIEISLLEVTAAGIEPPWTIRINPDERIPIEASEVHGIYNDDLDAAPPFAAVAPELRERLENADLAGFNVGRFDLRILHTEFVRAGVPIDFRQTRIIDAQVIFHRREPRDLGAALRFYAGREHTGAHGAEADTVATLEVFAGQLTRYPDLPVDVDPLHDTSVAQNAAFCDASRRFSWRDNEPVFNFGRLRGKSLRWVAADPNQRVYLHRFLEGSYEEDAKAIVREALKGQIRRRPGS